MRVMLEVQAIDGATKGRIGQEHRAMDSRHSTSRRATAETQSWRDTIATKMARKPSLQSCVMRNEPNAIGQVNWRRMGWKRRPQRLLTSMTKQPVDSSAED